MIPGLSSDAEARLLALMEDNATSVTAGHFASADFTILDGRDPTAAALGMTVTGGSIAIVVTDPTRPVGAVAIEARGRDGLLFIDNRAGCGTVQGTIRILGDECVVFINQSASGYVGLTTVLLRSHRQTLFWGIGATAVGISIELEGEGQGVCVGDDALIAGDVWIRNHDMHAIHDLRTGRLLSRPPMTTVLERHVWLAQEAMLLSCSRVGAGSIVGARSLVKGIVPACVLVAGAPARVIRTDVSWGRASAGMTEQETLSLGCSAFGNSCQDDTSLP